MTFDELINKSPQEVKELLEELKTLRERPDYHPEENSFEHVKIVVERLIQTGDIDLILAGLFHDLFKKRTAKINPKTGWPTSPGHDALGADFALHHSEFIKSLGGNPQDVSDICRQHMRVKQFDDMRSSKQNELRSMKIFGKLLTFTAADNMLEEFKIGQTVDNS